MDQKSQTALLGRPPPLLLPPPPAQLSSLSTLPPADRLLREPTLQSKRATVEAWLTREANTLQKYRLVRPRPQPPPLQLHPTSHRLSKIQHTLVKRFKLIVLTFTKILVAIIEAFSFFI